MEERDLALPFEVKDIHESFIKKLAKKTQIVVKNTIIRIMEILISLIGIILLIPLSIVVFFQNTKNGDDGSIFYTQDRIGKNGKTFKMYKFRTMVKNADQILETMLQDSEIRADYEKYRKFNNDPRLTKFGKVLSENTKANRKYFKRVEK